MDRAALVAAWSGMFGKPVPKSLSQPFLRRFLAFEVQARRMGGLPKGFVKDLDRYRARHVAPAGSDLKPGGRLLREWNGITHVVQVTEDGFRWNSASYRSLSAVARAITGARWSGPRFFGLGEAR
ncbi:DUF2924 domain-containing protein [Silicimonas algicola]|nr:DUF2924 domain-containing protein [Silicimonas algicola]